jgi:hypothetical protein
MRMNLHSTIWGKKYGNNHKCPSRFRKLRYIHTAENCAAVKNERKVPMNC